MNKRRIIIGSDHGGFELKEKIVPWLDKLGYEVEDKGTYEFDKLDDFPDYIAPVAKEVSRDENSRGLIFGGSGQGEAMMANRFKGVRASVFYGGDLKIIEETREDNNSNILSIGARFVSDEEAKEAIKIWLESPFSTNPKYERRNKKLDELVQ